MIHFLTFEDKKSIRRNSSKKIAYKDQHDPNDCYKKLRESSENARDYNLEENYEALKTLIAAGTQIL